MTPLSCPIFHGESVTVIADDRIAGMAFAGACDDRGAEGPTAVNEADAMAYWNHRAPPHRVA